MSPEERIVAQGCRNQVVLCNCSEISGKCKEPRRIKGTPGSFRRPLEKRDREKQEWAE